MQKNDSKRLVEYATKMSGWPKLASAKEELMVFAVSAFLWEKFLKEKILWELNAKEVDYFFRDDPKTGWTSEKELACVLDKAQKNIEARYLEYGHAHFFELGLIAKIHFLKFLIKNSPFQGEIHFVGQKKLVLGHEFSLLSKTQLAQISPLFLEFELKFSEVFHE